MSLDRWVFTSEQLNISSIRKTAQHKAEDSSLLLLPGKAQQLLWHLYPFSQWKSYHLPAHRHAVKNEGWAPPDKVDDEEEFPRAPLRTVGISTPPPFPPSLGGPQPGPVFPGFEEAEVAGLVAP